MIYISQLTPLNLLEEKQKFFADKSYNPQFVYPEPIDQSKLEMYGHSSSPYRELAEHILKRAYHHRNYEDLQMMQGPEVTDREVNEKIHKFLALHDLENKFEVSWSASYVARTTISSDQIKIRTPSSFRKQGLISMLYHEIGTHALRRSNYEKQPWFKKKNKFGFIEYLPTEEGLAVLHGLLPLDFQLAYKPAMSYLASAWAQSMSFAELYEKLKAYLPTEEARWRKATRLKRGLEDTSKPGGFTKDIVYFEGFVNVWHWLKEHDFNPTKLYFGKIAYEDAEKAVELNPYYEPELPSFYLTDPERYAKLLSRAGKENELDQVLVKL